MFLAAARCLAEQVSTADLELGRVYPPLSQISEVSALIATAVAEEAWNSGLATAARPDDVLTSIKSAMYTPVYPHYA